MRASFVVQGGEGGVENLGIHWDHRGMGRVARPHFNKATDPVLTLLKSPALNGL